jgi:RNA polymerase sigma factor (TIGR02999 family)
MPAHSPHQVTQLLLAWSDGDAAALEQLMPLVYDELRRLARRNMARENPGHTLQTTALVNEAYLRLVDWKNVQWQNRAHFFGVSAQLMRRILVDFARSRNQLKREGAARPVALEEAMAISHEPGADIIALDDALTALADIDPRKSQIVEMRFFGGLEMDEIAEVLKVSPITVKREWAKAKAWLYCQLNKEGPDEV